ncbi:hypothetical protein IKF20_03280 [Candidatus Saccharibacteria bacterium]|nr:hypothetical protein [Candidatus Saccharibacteria bacterium]
MIMKQQNNRDSLIICFTYYHLLISIIKVLHSKKPVDLIIEDFTTESGSIVLNDMDLIKRIEKSGLFRSVLVCNYRGIFSDDVSLWKKRIRRVFYIKRGKRKNDYNFESYKKIFVFGASLLQGVLDAKKIHYNIIEDGTDCYKNNYNIIKHSGIKYLIRRYIFRLYFVDGSSPYIDSIEVNDKSGLNINEKTIIEVPKKELFDSLTKKEKKKILEIFVPDLDQEKLKDAIVLITQPLSEDGILKNEEDKIDLYKSIIKMYNGKNIVIKVHPRENTDYSKYFSDGCQIINKKFPIELLDFYTDIKLKSIVTISSTSIGLISNVEKKIFLGWDYLEDFKRGRKHDE